MRVKDVFTEAVVTCGPETNLAEAIALLWENDCGTLPVVENSGKVIGILTDRHLCIAVGTANIRPSDRTAQDVMETRLITCKSSDHVRAALSLMREARVRRLPVVDETGIIEGIVSVDDIVNNIRRDHGNADAVSYGEMVTALDSICTRGTRVSSQLAAA